MRPRHAIADFRIRPAFDRPDYFRALVFRSEIAMRRYANAWKRRGGHAADIDTGSVGCVLSAQHWQRKGRGQPWTPRPYCGLVLFAKRWVNAEIVSHEATHAALSWLRRPK